MNRELGVQGQYQNHRGVTTQVPFAVASDSPSLAGERMSCFRLSNIARPCLRTLETTPRNSQQALPCASLRNVPLAHEKRAAPDGRRNSRRKRLLQRAAPLRVWEIGARTHGSMSQALQPAAGPGAKQRQEPASQVVVGRLMPGNHPPAGSEDSQISGSGRRSSVA